MRLVLSGAFEFGVRGINPEKLWLEFTAVVARKDAVVKGIVHGIYGWVNLNVSLGISKKCCPKLEIPYTSTREVNRPNKSDIASDLCAK